MYSIIHLLAVALPVAARVIPANKTPQDKGLMGIIFYNHNTNPQHISTDWAKDDVNQYPDLDWVYTILEPEDHVFIATDPCTSPKFFVSPTPNNRTAEVGSKRDHDTAVEATFQGGGDWTYFDVDIEKGFSVPIWCHGHGEEWNSGHGCVNDLLDECPECSRHYDNDTGIYDQCLPMNTVEDYAMRYRLCPDVYVKHDDDMTRTIKGHGESILDLWFSRIVMGLLMTSSP